MAIHITPEIVETTYELLRLTPPFQGWKLPHADALRFSVLKTKDRQGDFAVDEKGVPHIRISYTKHKTLHALAMTLAHEMCHLRDYYLNARSEHGASFHRLADQVCRHHCFDRGQF